ncbi:EAL domain-containing protein [Nocardioides anomalus]|uniref:EAL domain-containing protein n=1 Tax=Nocardioides anomalus TaxID=2712223 RepID=A0A6G6WCV6_9ACTN|nr:EAL domain-containing protein [Nocardioides anomalus]QIG43036.1 EAL domain-containing protein [Nocardioides anomalus]
MTTTTTSRLPDWLPRGRGIPDKTWDIRHRWVVWILVVQCFALFWFALFRGNSLTHSVFEAALPAEFALFASVQWFKRSVRAVFAATGLMVVSATLVHLSDGYIEAHFHFFVMIPLVALYESWLPFTVAVGTVLVHHGVMGTLDPQGTFNHAAGQHHPWVWGGIHALGILGACLGSIVYWRAQEKLRDSQAHLSTKLVHQASHDVLTGLPNRALFLGELERLLDLPVVDRPEVSVVLLDMDGFKEVNDMFGHGCGDLVLIEVARRLTASVRTGDMVTRLGGDEYAVLLVGANRHDVEGTSNRLQEELSQPFDLGGAHVDLEVSIGIATAGPDQDAVAVVRDADVAMYHAKEQRLGRVFYDEDQPLLHVGPHTGNRLALLGDLRRALAEHEIVLHYQPKVDLTNGRMVGAEALARWQHPERGLLQPGAFIDMVDRTNLSREFTAEVLDIALRQMREWQELGFEVPVSVNLSRRCLLDPSLPRMVTDALRRNGVRPHLLILEITEMTIVSDPELAVRILHTLRSLGVRMSLDDFGTGYSSLSYLKDLPIDELKIDRSFMRHLTEEGSRDSILVRATVGLAHDLGLSVVAEGVEDQATQRELGLLDCDVAQGFHFARPLPPSDLDDWLLRAQLPTPRAVS